MARYHFEKKAYYELTTLPGNKGVCVSHDAFVRGECQGQGIGSRAHNDRLCKMNELGYTYTIATVRSDNFAQVRIMEKFGWKKLDTFFMMDSNVPIYLYGQHLQTA